MRQDSQLLALASAATTLDPVLALVGKGMLTGPTSLKSLASSAGISSSKVPVLLGALRLAESAGVLAETSPGEWQATCTGSDAYELRLMLRGVSLYRMHLHSDEDEVVVVVSKPSAPSQLVGMLEETLQGFSGIETTAHTLAGLAQRAKHRFTLMTPFLDSAGVARAIELFETTSPGVLRQLVVRSPLPNELIARAPELMNLGVRIYDFRISRKGRSDKETFHAKVVRLDDDECYVGSSNMTQWSFDYSLELGVLVKGRAAKRISKILDSVIEVSVEVLPTDFLPNPNSALLPKKIS